MYSLEKEIIGYMFSLMMISLKERFSCIKIVSTKLDCLMGKKIFVSSINKPPAIISSIIILKGLLQLFLIIR